MQKLGFGEQPYLVYQHHDAGHPHIHIVTTNIQPNGNRIDLHHLGIRKSEPARKEIEKMFGLVVADEHARREAFRLKSVDIKKVQYGRTETKRAITNVLDAVLDKYKYTSLPELNAVLKQYNITADRGSEESRIFQGGGLVYRILDENGKPIGVPIKASDFYSKPTLKFLEEKYSSNDAKRQPFKARVKTEIDRLFVGKTPTLDELVVQLQKKGIHVALRRSDTGLIYGITYVDHQTKCVFNGSALGKQYSAKAIQERCSSLEAIKQDLLPNAGQKTGRSSLPAQNTNTGLPATLYNTTNPADTMPKDTVLDALLQPEQAADYIPGQLKKKGRKKKRRKNISNNQ
ncbi:relaxase/mobilization nuclease domain-containing protein [Niabella sp. W65]|nr:relaxase/mobilization nuclease domain-containing protein [Niabella sp. W65]MCH7362575.1 relaxase/mobilization nuclease domain-containing protein [Niabella sp. W65]ULT38527.1 relaxase/mobilization nuclease domain-containing protein [Niabella sp. I65]